jgi:hypothetical protein
MKAKAPWKGVHAKSKDPWSFTFDPTARHDEPDSPVTMAPTPTIEQSQAAPVSEEEIDLTPRRMSDSYVEVRARSLSPALDLDHS